MGQKCDLLFPLPEQSNKGRGDRKVILGIFRETLDHLPYGDQEKAVTKLFNILYNSNRILLKSDERLVLLNEIEEPASQIINGLQEKIKDVAAPIGRNEERVAKVLVGTHFELALAYRCLLAKPPVSGLLRSVDKLSYANYLRLSIHHLGEVLRTKYNVFSNPGGTIWKYIYTLFVCAYELNVHHISLSYLPWCRFHTVEDTFKSIVLLAMSSPLTMRGSDFNAFYELVPELTQYIDLGKIKCGENYSELLTFNLSGTEPPKKQLMTGCDSCGNASNCFTFGAKQLVEYFEDQKKLANKSMQLTIVQRFLKSQNQLDSLIQNLTGSGKVDHSERIAGGDFLVEIVVGFSDAYSYLSNRTTGTVNNAEEAVINGNIENWTTTGEETITVGDTGDWTTTGIVGTGLRRTSCKVINHSDGGYCLYIDANEKFHLRVGELAIVKESDVDNWHLAEIKWVSGHKKRMDFGVKLLESSVSTGTFRPVFSKNVDIDCLFLTVVDNNDESSVRIVTASSDFCKGDLLLVDCQGEEYQVSVERIWYKTNGYAEYICDWGDIKTGSAGAQEVNTEVGALAETDFDSLWDEL